MFILKPIRSWDLRRLIADKNVRDPFCSYNSETEAYYLVFEYFDVLWAGGSWLQGFLYKSWPVFTQSVPVMFKSYESCQAAAVRFGFFDLPLKYVVGHVVDSVDPLAVTYQFSDRLELSL